MFSLQFRGLLWAVFVVAATGVSSCNFALGDDDDDDDDDDSGVDCSELSQQLDAALAGFDVGFNSCEVDNDCVRVEEPSCAINCAVYTNRAREAAARVAIAGIEQEICVEGGYDTCERPAIACIPEPGMCVAGRCVPDGSGFPDDDDDNDDDDDDDNDDNDDDDDDDDDDVTSDDDDDVCDYDAMRAAYAKFEEEAKAYRACDEASDCTLRNESSRCQPSCGVSVSFEGQEEYVNALRAWDEEVCFEEFAACVDTVAVDCAVATGVACVEGLCEAKFDNPYTDAPYQNYLNSPDWWSCEEDSDCVTIESTCCVCDDMAVSAKYEDAWRQLAFSTDPCPFIDCAPNPPCEGEPKPKAMCLGGRCTIGAGEARRECDASRVCTTGCECYRDPFGCDLGMPICADALNTCNDGGSSTTCGEEAVCYASDGCALTPDGVDCSPSGDSLCRTLCEDAGDCSANYRCVEAIFDWGDVLENKSICLP